MGEGAWRLLSVGPGGRERAFDVVARWGSSGTSADRPNAAAGARERRGSRGAPFARSWEAEAKEGVGWRRTSGVQLAAMPAGGAERSGSCGGSWRTASPSKRERVVVVASRRRGAAPPADHDMAAVEAWSCGCWPHPAVDATCMAGDG